MQRKIKLYFCLVKICPNCHCLSAKARIIPISNSSNKTDFFILWEKVKWLLRLQMQPSKKSNFKQTSCPAALLHWGAYSTNACHMEDVGTCCSSYCYINHCCIALPQGGREIPSITWSNFAVWATDLWCCFDVKRSGGFVYWTTRSNVTLSIVLFFEHILWRCPQGPNDMIYVKLVVREKSCLWGCKQKWIHVYIHVTKTNEALPNVAVISGHELIS